MPGTGKTYHLVTLADLFEVPKERRPVLLAELAMWMEMVESSAALADAELRKVKPDLPPGPLVLPHYELDWIDDDEGNVNLRFFTGGDPEQKTIANLELGSYLEEGEK